MRRRRVWSDDNGSAALEFILVGLILLAPIVYLIVALGIIQSHALGVEAGARHLARTIATAADAADADDRATRVLQSISREYGLDADEVVVSIVCEPAHGGCPQEGAMIRVSVQSDVSLPLVPAVLGLDRLACVPVEAEAVQKVSRRWGGS